MVEFALGIRPRYYAGGRHTISPKQQNVTGVRLAQKFRFSQLLVLPGLLDLLAALLNHCFGRHLNVSRYFINPTVSFILIGRLQLECSVFFESGYFDVESAQVSEMGLNLVGKVRDIGKVYDAQ